MELLNIKTEILLSSSLGLDRKYQKEHNNLQDPTEKNIFYIQELGGNKFYEGALGKKYLNKRRFWEAGIEIIFQEYKHPIYEQRFEPFIPYLSVVDLLFNHGPDSLNIILNNQQMETNTSSTQ